MSNTSATGGYLLPTSTVPLPGTLTLDQFIQTVLVGLTNLNGNLVRPKFQKDQPKWPDNHVNWLSFRVMLERPDTYSYVGMDANGNTTQKRNEDVSVQCSFYGPDALAYTGLVRDGLQLQQNLDVLRASNFGFKETGVINLVPDLINEQWVQKFEMELVFRREVVRSYAILSVTTASGTITTDTTPPLETTFNTENIGD